MLNPRDYITKQGLRLLNRMTGGKRTTPELREPEPDEAPLSRHEIAQGLEDGTFHLPQKPLSIFTRTPRAKP